MYKSTCADSHGAPIQDSGLFLQETDWRDHPGVNGRFRYPGSPATVWNDYSNYVDSSIPGPSRLAVSPKSDAQCVSDLKARTNPSRPDIVPFTLLQDLYDIPRMLKDVGRLIKSPKKLLSPKEQANQYLGALFGWLPLVQDVHQLLNVQSLIHKRFGEIQRLHSGLGLRRSLHLDEGVATSESTYALQSGLGLIANIRRVSVTRYNKWGTIRWKPRDALPFNPNDANTIRQIRRAVIGLTPEGLNKGAWDLLPWSWIVDWFTNAHTATMGYSNFIPADSSHICLMTKYETIDEHIAPEHLNSECSGGSGLVSLIEKTRSVNVSASLTAHLPILDGGRLGILGALFVQRFK